MSRVTERGMDEGQEGRCGARSDEPEARSEVRWSARRKEGVVLRLLRGESLDLLARECGQPAGRIAGWREEFLAAGREGLKSRPGAVEDVALREAQRKVGELSIEVDILQALVERKGGHSVAEALEAVRAAARTAEDGVPGGWRVQVGGVRGAPPAGHLGAGAPATRPDRGDERHRAARTDPRCAGRQPVRR